MQVRDYHKRFYRPENLCIIITGMVESAIILKKIRQFEDDVILKVESASYSWISQTFLKTIL